MKKILTILTLAASLFAASVQSLRAQADTLPSSGQFVILTNLSGSAFSNVPVGTLSFDVSKQQNVAIEWTLFSDHATTVSNVGVRFVGLTISGTRASSPDLSDGFYMTRMSGGSTNLVVTTNFNVKGYSRLDLLYATNNSATGYISNQFRIYIKKNAP